MKLQPGEKLLAVYRQTKLLLVWYFILGVLLIYIPLNFVSKYQLAQSAGRLPWLWAVLVFLYFLNEIMLWRNNKTLLTSHRLLVITYHHILHKQVTDLPKDRIVNVSYVKKGLFPAIFDFGDLIIQQQSVNNPVELKRLANPMLAKDQIMAVTKQNLAN